MTSKKQQQVDRFMRTMRRFIRETDAVLDDEAQVVVVVERFWDSRNQPLIDVNE